MSSPLQGRSHQINLQKAIEMTTLYRQQKDTILRNEYLGKDILPISEAFNRKAVDKLLSQSECVGLRIYYSMDENLKLHAILVGVNDKDEDILPSGTAEKNSQTIQSQEGDPDDNDDAEGIILEESQVCPPYCPTDSPLNP